jgi:tRNA-modifying protein YgfZ
MQRDADDLPLPAVGALRARGADCARFLQGQLSQDIARVSSTRSALAGYHNPQGRVIALMRLVALGENDLIALMPRGLIAGVAARLAKFVLRSRVTLADESDRWDVYGVIDRGGGHADWPVEPNAQLAIGEARVACVGSSPARWLRIAPRSAGASAADPREAIDWQLLEIAGGQPQVYAVTSEVFVSQMLNLDLIGAIAFDKGCYTGQEIIARAHYRGRMKRRMQRFRTTDPLDLNPGDRGRFADGRGFQVVQSATSGDTTEFLAVTVPPGGGGGAGTDEAEHAAVIRAEQLPMPYELPA